MPISFRLGERAGILGLFRRKLYINVGESFFAPSSLSESETTALFFNTVKDLYNKKD